MSERGAEELHLLLERIAARLLDGTVGLQQLPVPLADLYNLGYFDGRASLADALAAAEDAADRYYRIAFDADASRVRLAGIPYAELCQRRGEWGRAAAAEALLAVRLADAGEAQ